MQSSLFDETPAEANESLEEINAEMLRRAKQMPQFAERVFVLGEGRVGPGRLILIRADRLWGLRDKCSTAFWKLSASNAKIAI